MKRNASHLQFSDRREMWRKKSARLCLFLSEAQRQKLKFACETENTGEGRKEMVVGTRKMTIPRVSDSASASQLIWASFSPFEPIVFYDTPISQSVRDCLGLFFKDLKTVLKNICQVFPCI